MERKKGWKGKGGEEAKKEGLKKGRNGQEDKRYRSKIRTDIYKKLTSLCIRFYLLFLFA